MNRLHFFQIKFVVYSSSVYCVVSPSHLTCKMKLKASCVVKVSLQIYYRVKSSKILFWSVFRSQTHM